MFNYFKNKKQKAVERDEGAIRKSSEDFLKEDEYRKSIEESAAFFKADREARKAAGLENKPGEYTFTCPNCGSECKGSWHAMYGMDNLHGSTDCFTCDIHLIV